MQHTISTISTISKSALTGLALACAGLVMAPGLSAATDYPNKSVRWVVPFAPGAANDIIARLIATGLSSRLGQTVVVDNRAGAGGALGAGIVANAPADGYTLLLANPGPNVSNPILMKSVPYKIESFDPVIAFGYVPLLIMAHPSFPANNPRELVAYLKANPGKVNWGSSGNLSNPHIALELFGLASGTQIQHVPYKGSGPALIDLLAGQIQLMHSSLASVEGHVKERRLKIVAVASDKRIPQFPDVGVLAEAGVNGAEAVTWFGMAVPAGTPRDIVAKLNAEANQVMRLPEVQSRLATLGLTPLGGPPQVLEKLINADATGLRKLLASGALKSQ